MGTLRNTADKKKGQLSRIGPGVISGAANDDPSCIVTYSMAGAALGYATLWTSLFGLPLLAAVQFMCARLGMVSGRGLAGALRLHSPKWVLFSMCALLAIANIVTLGADLGGMAEVTAMVTGIPAVACTLIYAIAIAALLFYLPFTRIEKIFKWLCLALFTYLAAGFLARADWRAALMDTVLPRVQWSKEYLSIIVAIIGATMSPYFLFWQASQKVEEEYCLGRRTVAQRKGATRQELDDTRVDVFAGAFISKLITYFIT
ncbi:MAG: divalent metal cation transporter, partial [Acidobacteriota bacterium]|nr:divalent metal cation transporter [Acidobacteriota bacterium]